jgi:hypothetical protein
MACCLCHRLFCLRMRGWIILVGPGGLSAETKVADTSVCWSFLSRPVSQMRYRASLFLGVLVVLSWREGLVSIVAISFQLIAIVAKYLKVVDIIASPHRFGNDVIDGEEGAAAAANTAMLVAFKDHSSFGF